MLITKRDEVTKQGFCKTLWKKLRLVTRVLVLIQFQFQFIATQVSGVGVGAYLSLIGRRRGGVGVGWALIRSWALINFFCL